MKKGLRRSAATIIETRVGLNEDLMKKGLRRSLRVPLTMAVRPFERRPDEEGIKTRVHRRCGSVFPEFERRPDEEGIKTLSPYSDCPLPRLNEDLMKKGLRPSTKHCLHLRMGFERRPDEEGIKTEPLCRDRPFRAV